MTKDEARSCVMGAISMALKDPILQQGFEIICKENAELKERNIKAIGIVKILKDGLSMYSGAYQKEIAEAEQFLSEVEE